MNATTLGVLAAVVVRSILATGYGVGEVIGWRYDRRTDRLAR